MIRKIMAAFVLTLLATAILLPGTACRRTQDNTWQMTGVPSVDSATGLDVLL